MTMVAVTSSSGARLPAGKAFHVLMMEERHKRRLDPKKLAKYARVTEEEYRTWEAGKAVPTVVQCQHMFGKNSALVEMTREIARASAIMAEAGAVEVPAVPKIEIAPNFVQLATELRGEKAVSYDVPRTDPPSVVPALPAMPSVHATNDAAAEMTQPPSPSPTPPAPPPMTLVEVGAAIVAARKAKGMSREALARAIGVDGTTVLNWERGKCLPIARRYNDLLEALPDLKALPRPNLHDMASPGRKRGAPTASNEPKEKKPARAKPTADIAKPSVDAEPISTPTPSIEPTPPIDTLVALEAVIAAYAVIGVALTPHFDRHDSLWWVTLRDKATDGVVVESVSATLPEAVRRAIVSMKKSLAKRVDDVRAEWLDVDKRKTVLETALTSVAQIADENARK